jgi:uncharacterized membrane protein
MGVIRDTFHVNAPVDVVWEMNADCSQIPEWNVNVIEVKGCPGRIDQLGARFTTVAKVMGRRVEATVDTTFVDRPRSMEQRGDSSTGVASTRVEFTEVRGGTDVAIRFDYQIAAGIFGGIAERLALRTIERDIRRSNMRFKALCEAAGRS